MVLSCLHSHPLCLPLHIGFFTAVSYASPSTALFHASLSALPRTVPHVSSTAVPSCHFHSRFSMSFFHSILSCQSLHGFPPCQPIPGFSVTPARIALAASSVEFFCDAIAALHRASPNFAPQMPSDAIFFEYDLRLVFFAFASPEGRQGLFWRISVLSVPKRSMAPTIPGRTVVDFRGDFWQKRVVDTVHTSLWHGSGIGPLPFDIRLLLPYIAFVSALRAGRGYRKGDGIGSSLFC